MREVIPIYYLVQKDGSIRMLNVYDVSTSATVKNGFIRVQEVDCK